MTVGAATATMGAVAAPTDTLGQAPASATNVAAQQAQQQQLQSLLPQMGHCAQLNLPGMLSLMGNNNLQQLRTLQLMQLCNGVGVGGFNNPMMQFAMMGLTNPLSMSAQSVPMIINNTLYPCGNGCACNQHSILNPTNGL